MKKVLPGAGLILSCQGWKISASTTLAQTVALPPLLIRCNMLLLHCQFRPPSSSNKLESSGLLSASRKEAKPS